MTIARTTAGLGLAQAVNSVTNFIVVALVARSLSSADFSEFAIAQAFLLLGQVALQAGSADQFLRANDPTVLRRLRGQAAGAMRVVFGCGLFLAVALALVPADGVQARSGCIFTLVAVAVNDFARSTLVSEQLIGATVCFDLCFGALQVGAFTLVSHQFGLSQTTVWWLWGLTALPTAAWVWLRRLRPEHYIGSRGDRRFSFRWRYSAELLVALGASQIAQLLVIPVFGLSFAGVYRGGQLLLGPAAILITGSRNTLISIYRRDQDHMRGVFMGASIVLTTVIAAWTAVAYFAPDSLLLHLLGPTGHHAQELVIPLGLAYVATAMYGASYYFARTRGHDRVTTRSRVIELVVLLITTIVSVALRSPALFVVGGAVSSFAAMSYIVSRSIWPDSPAHVDNPQPDGSLLPGG